MLERQDLGALAARWAAASPFPHVTVDDAVDPATLARLLAALDEEPAERIVDDIFEVLATAEPPRHPDLARLLESLGAAASLAAIEAITGHAVSRVDMRGYAYHAGHYLLPHADHREGSTRAVAYVLYVAALPTEGRFEGGELELFECDVDHGAIVRTTPTRRIRPVPGRLVLFEVGPTTLHRVCEVTSGVRLSLTGWFSR